MRSCCASCPIFQILSYRAIHPRDELFWPFAVRALLQMQPRRLLAGEQQCFWLHALAERHAVRLGHAPAREREVSIAAAALGLVPADGFSAAGAEAHGLSPGERMGKGLPKLYR